MPHMSTFGFGPEMIDFRTVLAAASLLGFALVLIMGGGNLGNGETCE
jgi:hypothetical protein